MIKEEIRKMAKLLDDLEAIEEAARRVDVSRKVTFTYISNGVQQAITFVEDCPPSCSEGGCKLTSTDIAADVLSLLQRRWLLMLSARSGRKSWKSLKHLDMRNLIPDLKRNNQETA